MINGFRALILTTLCALLMTACQQNETQKRPHAKAMDIAPTRSTRQSETEQNKLLLQSIGKDSAALITNAKKVLAPAALADLSRLNPNTARTQISALSAKTANLLDRAEKAAEKAGDAKESATDSRQLHDLLDLYESAMLHGCDAELVGCDLIALFASDPNSTRIARAVAERESDIANKYRLLRLAYAFKNHGADPQLELAYLKDAKTYFDLLTQKQDPKLQTRADEHVRIVTQILMDLNTNPRAEFDPAILAGFRPWEFDRVRVKGLERVDELVLSLSARSTIYTTPEMKEIAPAFKEQLNSLGQSENGLVKRMQDLSKTQPQLFKTLGLPDSFALDENFFIFEGLYNGQMNINDASNIWKGTRQDITQARALFDSYVRVRLALLINDSNQVMQSFFTSKGNFTSSSVLLLALEEGKKVERFWADGYKRLDLLKAFADRYFKDGSEASLKTELFFAGLPRNVKFLSTYPSMLLMSYHLARLEASLTIQTFAGPVEITATEIVSYFFDGKYQPWFNFSRDDVPLKKSDLYQVFAFTLRTGMLAGAGISERDFFKVLSARNLANFETLAEFNRGFRMNFDKRPQFQEFRRICQRVKAGSTPYENEMAFEKLTNYSMLGLPDHISQAYSSETLAAGWYLYDTDREGKKWQMSAIAELGRLDFGARLEQMKLFAALIVEHVREIDGDEKALAIKTDLDAVLKPYSDALAELFGHFFRLHQEIADCMDQVIDFEFKGEKFLVRAYIAHLKAVHAEMTKLQGAASANQLHQEFHLSQTPGLAFGGLEQYEANLGYTAQKYRLSQLQVLLRFRHALENGAVTENGQESAMRPVGSIVLPDNIRNINEKIRARSAEISYVADVNAFVGAGLRELFANRNPLVNWFDISTVPGAYLRSLRLLASLYKLGEVDVRICQNGSCEERKAKITADELISRSLNVARRLELDPEWTRTLQLANINSRYPTPIYLVDYAYREDDRSPYGLLDYVFNLVRKSYLAEESPPGMAPVIPMDEAKRYFVSTQSLQVNAFSLPDAYVQILERYHTDLVKQEVGKQTKLVTTARDLEKTGQTLPTWRFSLAALRSPAPAVLSENAVQTFRAELVQFGREIQRPISKDLLNKLQ